MCVLSLMCSSVIDLAQMNLQSCQYVVYDFSSFAVSSFKIKGNQNACFCVSDPEL
jgi:hypothetical protein